MERFIAERLYGSQKRTGGGSRPAVIIVTAGIALGLAVMIITIAVTRGFQSEIESKVIGFTQHLNITNYHSSPGWSESPMTFTEELREELESCASVKFVQPYIQKTAVLKSEGSFAGIMLKGVGEDYDFSFLKQSLTAGRIPDPQSDSPATGWLLLSEKTARANGLQTGSKVQVYFLQNSVRARNMTLIGTFCTNFSEYDKLWGITDMATLGKLNGWDEDKVGGVEVRLMPSATLDSGYVQTRTVMNRVEEKREDEGYLIQTMTNLNAGLFAWLDILNVNVVAILVLMMGIAGFTMVSGLLIIIFERIRTIGLLKSLGASDRMIRKVFLHIAARIVVKGMVTGNVVGITVCLLQTWLKLLPLDPANYYLDSVPMHLEIAPLILLNLAMFTISMLILMAPGTIIAKIQPAESMSFE